MNNHIIVEEQLKCYHCGEQCPDELLHVEDKHFCCHGCQTVYEILQDNNLCTYYDLNQNAGVSLKAKNFEGKYAYLDTLPIQEQLLDYQSETLNKVTFYIPAVHCSSCVWLLENFNKVRTGVKTTRLNFLRKELSITYNPQEVNLRQIVELLATLGYEPLINLESSEKQSSHNPQQRRLLLQIGVVGFCMGNIMLMSFPEYFHLDLNNLIDATYQRFFLYLNFVLSLPVFFFGASDYLKGAWISLQENLKRTTNVLSVDIPITLGITALFLRSCYETFFNQSAGYWDSLAGLVFFLLTGKWVQQVTYNYLSFERNYKSYFPLAVKVLREDIEQYLNVSELKKGDVMTIHHQELIPADSLLVEGRGLLDYSFVTGESEPVEKQKGDMVYAGGRQVGESFKLMVQKPVSQSYLTQLWNNDAFNKEKPIPTTELANAFSKYFTYITFGIAALTGLYWHFNEPALMWKTVTAVLMVACPCALTLSMPFTMNTTMAIFGRNKFYVKNQGVIQLLTEVNEVAFDKTGTLTEGNNGNVHYEGMPLTAAEEHGVWTLASASAHPLSKMIAKYTQTRLAKDLPIDSAIVGIRETKGQGIEGVVQDVLVRLGNEMLINVPHSKVHKHSQVHIEIDGEYKGFFTVEANYRANWQETLNKLKRSFKLVLLSGDNDAERERLSTYFYKDALLFNQKPQDKLNFIKKEQDKNHHVLMIGDGLNDAGALRQSNIGIALSEDVQAFSPACDAILDASQFGKLGDFMSFSRTALSIVKASFILSLVYNFIGIGWAVSGELSPVMAAIFMPISTLTVVLFAVGNTYLFASLKGFLKI
jgi:P-type Cu+ transporter